MKIPRQHFGFNRTLLALTLLAAFGPAHADEAEMAQLTKPDSSEVSVGLGAVSGDSKDRTIFGQYNGLRKNDANLLLDFDYVRRNDATGLWTNADGRNIGLDNREFRFSQQKQGDWKYSAEYNEMVRHDPRTINTGLQGAGTTSPTVVSVAAPGAGSDLNLELKRKGLTLSGEKWIMPNLLFEASFKNEDKDGARLSGIGVTCNALGITGMPLCSTSTGALLLLPEPINYTTRQFELKLNYSGDAFMLSGGYYGSFFSNSNGSLTLGGVTGGTGTLFNPNSTALAATVPVTTLLGYLQQPVALPPDNQAHQLYLSGNYAFTPTTRATFKYAYTHATQDESFGGTGLTGAPAGASNLSGVLNSTLAQVGLTARPVPKLSMLLNWRYEDKNDKTPYSLFTGAFTSSSSRKVNGKAEATYQLPDNYRATVGVDYTYVKRDRPVGSGVIPATSLTALREETEELGYRAELRRSMSETLNAAIGYEQSKRDGYNWYSIAAGYPSVSDAAIYNATGTFPMTMMNRKRDKVKVSADWTPISTLSLQFMFEDGKDKYEAPTQAGLHNTGMNSYGVDAALTLSDAWKLTGYVNQAKQTLHVDHNLGYIAALADNSTSVGIGVVGKPSSKIEVGGDLSYLDDSNTYNQSMATGAAIVGGGLPDVTYRVTTLKLFGKYALDNNADIRVDLVHQRAKFNEWTWGYNGTPFAYSDNTTVSMQPNQNVTFLGARYIYKFK